MAVFPPPLIPSDLVDEDRHPALKRFLRVQVDMQVADRRVMLRLPVPVLDPHVGGNLTTTAALLNLISGFSVWLFETDEAVTIRAREAKERKRYSGRRFKSFVTTYWPDVSPEPQAADWIAERLYETRNSLVHDLGATDDPRREEPRSFQLGKIPSPAYDVVTTLERSLSHPLVVPVIRQLGDGFAVSVDGLYWAAHWMLRAAIEDRADAINREITGKFFPDISTAAQ